MATKKRIKLEQEIYKRIYCSLTQETKPSLDLTERCVMASMWIVKLIHNNYRRRKY